MLERQPTEVSIQSTMNDRHDDRRDRTDRRTDRTTERERYRDESGDWTEGNTGRPRDGGQHHPREHVDQPGQSDEDVSNRRHVHHGEQGDDGTPHDQY
ncbi:hypothetical protein D8Y22_04610 [Salinadaptatus halalkaliphilus]|uniref:Uncharacterized protein n=1 Tax=Salinadaptatus halalkaliphilus TaxID=2419781 RepID=A0A4S3TPC3_9EURY|nr:hypothetical protein D8Y22_04610 [Salinadaptatus halalkaliphilus]